MKYPPPGPESGDSTDELVVHEIHAPPLIQPGRRGRRRPVQRLGLPSAFTRPHLWSLKPVELSHALLIHEPPVPPEMDMNPKVREARPRNRQVSHGHPQRRLSPGRAGPPPHIS